MGVVKGAVGCAVLALIAGQELSSLDAGRRASLWTGVRAVFGGSAPDRPPGRGQAAPGPANAVAAVQVAPQVAVPGYGEEWIAADRLGQFRTAAEIDGRRFPALVDTGATFVALSAEDADRFGLRPASSDYRYAVETANGRARVAKVQLASVRLGGIELRDVTALVGAPGQLGETLLGMSFLSRLSGVRIDRGRLVLTR